MSDDKKTTPPSSGDGGQCSDGTSPPCVICKLVSITVVQNATQTNVTGAKNWAAVKKGTDDVIVQATTDPNIPACWNKINWSGDSGVPVPGHPNQRSVSRSSSKKYHVEASLGGVSDFVDVWILWATVTNNTSGTTPPNAVQYGASYDGTENLGAKLYDSGNKAVGKVVPDAKITPNGVHDIVKGGWSFKRERMSHDWQGGAKVQEGNGPTDYWNTTWVDDTSYASYQKLIPDSDDKIYDRDAPSVWLVSADDYETYNNFREWTEWNSEVCSEKAEWHWRARCERSKSPRVSYADLGTGNPALPANSLLHP